jgi:hypothetical protein
VAAVEPSLVALQGEFIVAAKPVVLSFLLCRDLIVDARTSEVALLRPFYEVVGTAFPLLVSVSVYSTWREVEGTYQLQSQLLDPEGEVAWSYTEANPLVGRDRFTVHQIILHPLRLVVPEPRMYDFILTANGEEVWRTLSRVRLTRAGGRRSLRFPRPVR